MKQQDSTQIRIKADKLGLIKTDISTNTHLRTPVIKLKNKVPKHLIQTQTIKINPKTQYQKLNHNDSIYLNLIPTESDKLFDNKLSFKITPPSSGELTASSEKESLSTPDTLKKEQLTIKTAKPDNLKTITIQPSQSNPIKIRSSNHFEGSKEWLSGFIILALLIAGLVKLTAGRYLNDIFSSIRYQQSATKLFSTYNIQNQKPSWALSALFILCTSLLIFEYTMVMSQQPESTSNIGFFLFIFACVFSYFLFKSIAYRFVAFIFDTLTDTKAYLFNSDLLNKTFGIIILPLVSIVPFIDQRTAGFLLKAGIALFILMYAVQLLRGVKIILHSPLSIFYMFLYFCVLEILPLSILIKIIFL